MTDPIAHRGGDSTTCHPDAGLRRDIERAETRSKQTDLSPEVQRARSSRPKASNTTWWQPFAGFPLSMCVCRSANGFWVSVLCSVSCLPRTRPHAGHRRGRRCAGRTTTTASGVAVIMEGRPGCGRMRRSTKESSRGWSTAQERACSARAAMAKVLERPRVTMPRPEPARRPREDKSGVISGTNRRSSTPTRHPRYAHRLALFNEGVHHGGHSAQAQ